MVVTCCASDSEKRGLALSGVIVVSRLTENIVHAAVPRLLSDATTAAASAFAIGQAVSGPGRALSLAFEFLHAATFGTLAKLAFVVIALGLATGWSILLAVPAFVQEQTVQKSNIVITQDPSPKSNKALIVRAADYIEAGKQPGVFYTAGLLGAGQYSLPADSRLDVVKAISLVRGLGDQVPFERRDLAEYVESFVDTWTPPPSRVTILRRTANGGETRLEFDLSTALPEANQRILIQDGDIIVLRRSEHGPVVAFCLSQARNIDTVIRVYQAANKAMTAQDKGSS